jgi:iron(III) transport system permease protein
MNPLARTLSFPFVSRSPARPRPAFRLSALSLITALIVAVVSLPVVYLIIRAASSGIDGIDYLLQARTLRVIGNSLLLTVTVVIASGIIGVAFAWLTTRTNLPYRRAILVLGLLPMVIPSYIGALTLVAGLGPVGYLQQLLEPLGVRRLPDIYGFFGAALSITLFTYPYFVLPVRAALLHSDRSLEESAQALGRSRRAIFWEITLPLLRPSIAAGALLTALYTLSDFGAVMVMRFNAFARAIFLTYNSAFDRDRAALLALVLVALTLLLVWLERRAAARIQTYRIGKGCARRSQRIALGRWTLPALAFCGILIAIGVLLPVGVLLGWALDPYQPATFEIDLVELSQNAISVSALTALVVAACAFPLALSGRRGGTGFGRSLVSLAYIGNALPGVVIGLALVFFGANALPAVYQTLPLLILGYAIRFLPYSIAATNSALSGMSPSMENAAQSLGLNRWAIFWRVTLPLTWTSVMAGMALVFLNVMKELPTTLMLAPIGYHTLVTRIWTASESAMLSLIGTPGLLLIGFSCIGLVLLLWREPGARESGEAAR